MDSFNNYYQEAEKHDIPIRVKMKQEVDMVDPKYQESVGLGIVFILIVLVLVLLRK